jgi:uncharacterized protein YndB with AHSA1/START domain
VSPAAQGVVELERRIAARPETVFAYLTDPERYRLWMGVDAELDPRPGGAFRVPITGRSRTVHVRGEYVEVKPPKRIVFTWGWEQIDGLPLGADGVSPGTSTVEIDLAADGDTTVLRLRHTGLPTDAACQFHTWGWNVTLDRVVVAAEGGDPGPYALIDL